MPSPVPRESLRIVHSEADADVCRPNTTVSRGAPGRYFCLEQAVADSVRDPGARVGDPKHQEARGVLAAERERDGSVGRVFPGIGQAVLDDVIEQVQIKFHVDGLVVARRGVVAGGVPFRPKGALEAELDAAVAAVRGAGDGALGVELGPQKSSEPDDLGGDHVAASPVWKSSDQLAALTRTSVSSTAAECAFDFNTGPRRIL